MGGISSSTGLVSGLPIHDIVSQLMAVEARPRELVQQRNSELEARQNAFQEVNSALLALREAASGLTRPTAFRNTAATSSNESVLTASTGTGAIPGTYHLHVDQLVTAQQNLSRGFADIDQTTFGETTLTLERGAARLESTTELARLNGGEGVERGRIRITDRAGSAQIIDLGTAVTLNDVVTRINDATGVNVTARVDGDRLVLEDHTGQTGSNLRLENVGGRNTATDLGLDQSISGDTLTGEPINTLGRASALSHLNDDTGVDVKQDEPDFRIHTSDGAAHDIDLAGAITLGDVIEQIENQSDGNVTAAIANDGVSLTLTDQTGGGPDFSVTALNDSAAATDLGILASDDDATGTIEGHRLVAAMNSKLTRMLNGGAGVDLGTISITDRAGTADTIDLAGAHSVSDILARLNASDANITAALNDAGHGLVIRDHSGGSGDLQISDVTGSAASDLNLAGSHDADTADSGRLALQYVGQATRLETLGVARGAFVITDSTGQSATVDLESGDARTVGDVIRLINARSIDVTARINDAGNGIVLEDDAGGSVPMRVEESGSTTARDLNLLGEADEPGAAIDGGFAVTVDIDADDTLTDIVNRINSEGLDVRASIVNDGSEGAPFRVLLASREGGTDHAFVFDDGGLGLGATRFSEARDATVFFGAANPADALTLRSSSNQLEEVLPDTTIDLNATSDQAVQLTVERDHGAVVDAVQSFVDRFNAVIEKLDEHDFYDAETNERGVLLGEAAVSNVRRTLFTQINRRSDEVDGQFRSLTEVGVTVGEGGTLELDESTLRSALGNDLSAVRQLFTLRRSETDEDTGEREMVRAGLGVRIEEVLFRLTDREFGSVNRQIETIDRQIELNDRRIESLDDRLESRRNRLLAEFFAMEQAIASMQQQNDALAGLRMLAQQNRVN